MRHGQCAEFLIEVDQIFAALVVQCFEDKSSQSLLSKRKLKVEDEPQFRAMCEIERERRSPSR